MIDSSSESGPPPLALTITEGLRGAIDFATLFMSAPFLAAAPRGERQTVIVLPGFTLDDSATFALRSYLTWLGHTVHGMDLGPNFGRRTFGEQNRRLSTLVARVRGEDKVTLIGHSLGGVVAREYARANPDHVARVISLGSPYAGDETSMPAGVVWLRRRLTGEDPHARADRSPLPVPHTAIYSAGDGIVSPFDCRDINPGADNVEITGSHVGLMVNAAAFGVIAERLAGMARERPVPMQAAE
jgi:pimeloyl-ACP methyl ester carboxylesterase